jgi:ribosomal protein S6--L-glutamate ligase
LLTTVPGATNVWGAEVFRDSGDFVAAGGRGRPAEGGEGRVRIGIISRNPGVYTTRRVVAAAAAAGHEALVIDQTDCALIVGGRGPRVIYRGAPLPAMGVVIPRIGPTAMDYGIALIRQFEAMGVPTLNGAAALAAAKDRLQCLQTLHAAGLPVPQTVLARSPCGAERAVEAAGGAPVMLKLPRSAKGIGVMVGESAAAARAVLETFWALDEDLLVQEQIPTGLRRDVRVLVLEGEVVAAVERVAREGDFRANIHRGALVSAVEPSEEQAGMAVAAAGALGLRLAGVDLVESARGPVVLEVNGTPGIEGPEGATGRDIAALIVRAAVGLTA